MRRIVVVSITALLGVGCSTEFSGTGGATRNTSSTDGQPKDFDENSEQQDSGDAVPEDGSGSISLDSGENCIVRDSGFDPIINFESAPDPSQPTQHRNLAITTQYKDTHAVTFSSPNQTAIIRKTTRRGEAQLPESELAWKCILCNGLPSNNRLLNASAEAAVGDYVLSSTAASQFVASDFTVEYSIPTKSLSFDLIDVDGSEVWIVDVFDTNGDEIPELSQEVSEDGYNTNTTGNGQPTRVNIDDNNVTPRIGGFTIRGTKDSLAFGYAFDNFRTGVPSCPEED